MLQASFATALILIGVDASAKQDRHCIVALEAQTPSTQQRADPSPPKPPCPVAVGFPLKSRTAPTRVIAERAASSNDSPHEVAQPGTIEPGIALHV
jgi:hypothetical protein